MLRLRPVLDGKGEFGVVAPSASPPQPETQPAPPPVHAGPEATASNGSESSGGRDQRQTRLGIVSVAQIRFWRFAVWVIPVLVGFGAHRSSRALQRFEATRQAELEASSPEGTPEARETGRPAPSAD